MPNCELNLFAQYPQTPRMQRQREITDDEQIIARRFDQAFFDGSVTYGYGGLQYNPNYWPIVIAEFQRHYGLNARNSVLDVGCAKGFMLYDMTRLIPGIHVKGVDISSYAIDHVIETMKPHCQVACATQLPFQDASFDLVISIVTLQNLDFCDLVTAVQEIERVKRTHSFIAIDSYRDKTVRTLTSKTLMDENEWKQFFNDVGYTGDYNCISQHLAW